MLRTRNNWLDSGIQNSIKIPKFEIFKKFKFMTHHIVLGNMCAKYEGNRSSGYEVMLRTRCDRHTHAHTDRHTAIIELPAAAKNDSVIDHASKAKMTQWPK